MTLADSKPVKRIRDKAVYAQFHAAGHRCLCCSLWNVEAAHLLRGNKREDVLEALIPLCPACHGAFDSRQSVEIGRVFCHPDVVDPSVARYLRSEQGKKSAAYLISRLGPFGAEDYVQRLERG